MAEETSYNEIVAKQANGRFTKQDIQRARYGAKLDEKRYERRQTAIRYFKILVTFSGGATAIAKALETFHIKLF